MKVSKATSGLHMYRQCFKINFSNARWTVVCILWLVTFFPYKVQLCVLANTFIDCIYSCSEVTESKNVWLWIVSIVRTRVMKFHCPIIYHSIRYYLWSDNYRHNAPLRDQLNWLLQSCPCSSVHILTTTIHCWFEKNNFLLENHSPTHILQCFVHYSRL